MGKIKAALILKFRFAMAIKTCDTTERLSKCGALARLFRAPGAHITKCANIRGKLKRLGGPSNWNKIGKHGHAYETTPEPSTRGVVDITQDACLKLQLLQSILDDIADADDTG